MRSALPDDTSKKAAAAPPPGERQRKGRGFVNTRGESEASTLIAPLARLHLQSSTPQTSTGAKESSEPPKREESVSRKSSVADLASDASVAPSGKYSVRARMEEKGIIDPDPPKVDTLLPYLRPESDCTTFSALQSECNVDTDEWY